MRRCIRSPLGGQTLVWVTALLPLFFSVIGLVIDAGIVFDHRRELQNTADAAARAGATQIDERAYRRSGGRRLVLDPSRARRVAGEYLAGRNTQGTVSVGETRVTVRATQVVRLSFLSSLGFRTVSLSAVAPAQVRHGVREAAP